MRHGERARNRHGPIWGAEKQRAGKKRAGQASAPGRAAHAQQREEGWPGDPSDSSNEPADDLASQDAGNGRIRASNRAVGALSEEHRPCEAGPG